ncbi:MAG: bifunctional 4-hydroxy-2-oxoglutarate aldolase/2-dehydro-3-deoxy-phosphogluconate aldolase [Spirochaetia bacterium]|jgi:Entner-Doudoroff aldolase|nr:bifunctional 4-hydroxy-2-oxoglutarate aldolase/2-dehydro-3-deoxy-phosphogluconate aldolase [Spirochaetia bacterium]
MSDIAAELKKHKLVTVAVLDDPADALNLSEVLARRGLPFLEITLRTEAALDCIEAAAKNFPELTVGAGSVADIRSLQAAKNAGASFAVSAGFDSGIISAAEGLGMPFIPGAATPTEIMAALKFCKIIKIFPAALLGGSAYINAISAPFASREFHLMPTGGIDASNLGEYLKAARVIACGMSWIAERGLIAAKDFKAVEERAAITASILKSHEP